MMRRVATGLLSLLCFLPAFAHPGWGIVVDREGSVYYTDLSQVWKIGADKKRTVAITGVHTHELYLDPAGTLHGEHLWYDNKAAKWWHYDWDLSNGKVVRHDPVEGFRTNESFVRDGTGTMYWLDGGRILKRAPGGQVVEVATVPSRPPEPGRGRGGLITVRPEGTIYVISDGDLYRVRPRGRPELMASKLDEHVWSSFMTQPWHYIMSLAADAAGNVYVANLGARKLKRVSPEGTVDVVLRSRAPWGPTGVTITPRGIYVLEYADTGGSVRVRRIESDGRVVPVP